MRRSGKIKFASKAWEHFNFIYFLYTVLNILWLLGHLTFLVGHTAIVPLGLSSPFEISLLIKGILLMVTWISFDWYKIFSGLALVWGGESKER